MRLPCSIRRGAHARGAHAEWRRGRGRGGWGARAKGAEEVGAQGGLFGGAQRGVALAHGTEASSLRRAAYGYFFDCRVK